VRIAKPEWVSGNVYIRPNVLEETGDRVDGHKHNFDHTTIVFRGAMHVRARKPDGTVIERDFEAPAHFLVKADVEHEITATKPDTEFWCVYSHRDPQGRIILNYDGWTPAYL
jgi:hypothetical protein